MEYVRAYILRTDTNRNLIQRGVRQCRAQSKSYVLVFHKEIILAKSFDSFKRVCIKLQVRSMFSITYVDFSIYKSNHKLHYIHAMEKIGPPFDAE